MYGMLAGFMIPSRGKGAGLGNRVGGDAYGEEGAYGDEGQHR
jgi:hypothetical protein